MGILNANNFGQIALPILSAWHGTSYRGRLPKPKLVHLDPGYQDFVFQFVPSEITRNVSAIYGEETAMGREHPVMQYVGRGPETYEFSAMFFAETYADSIQAQVDTLVDMTKVDTKLRRPPLWRLEWGDITFESPLVLESVGGIKYSDVRTNDNAGQQVAQAVGGFAAGLSRSPASIAGALVSINGARSAASAGKTLRAVTVNIILRLYHPFDIQISGPGDPNPDTFYHYVREGETYEHIAAIHYGDALKGEFLRQRNPKSVEVSAGDVVIVSRPEKFQGLTPIPRSIPLRRVRNASLLRRQRFEQRRDPIVMYGPEAGA